LLAFLLPVYNILVAIVIILIVLNWFAEGQFLTKFKRVLSDKRRAFLISFAALYLIYGVGLLYSKNFSEGIFGLQVKLSILVFPVIFATIDKDILSGKKIYHLFYAFILGCFLVSCGLLINAFTNFLQSSDLNQFYYTSLSAYLHTAYISMYLNLSVAIILFILITHWKTLRNIHKLILGLLFAFFYTLIILLSSKAGISTLILILISYIFFLIIKVRKYMVGFFSGVLAVVSFIVAFNLFPVPLERFYAAEKTLKRIDQLTSEDTESTAERIAIWRAASDLAMENFVAGVGIGDVKEQLCVMYQKKKIMQAYSLQLNAHNQYLQTFATTGVIGFIVMVLCLLVPLYYSIKNNHFIYFLFLMIIGFNFLFESMLCRQAGVVFYAYFNALFLYTGLTNSSYYRIK